MIRYVHLIDISRWGVSMQGFVSFLGYVMFGDKYLAKFSDPTGEAPFFLSKEECQERLDNLKKNGFVYQDTEKAVNEWPADRPYIV